jgi:tetratricopeptide (TPR) repeat protein
VAGRDLHLYPSSSDGPTRQAEAASKVGKYVKTGDDLHAQGRYADAEIAFREAIRLDPESASAHNGLGFALREMGQYPEAETALRKATLFDPGMAGAHKCLGRVLQDSGRHQEAEAAFLQAIHLNPSDANAHNGLGNVLRDLGRYPKAEAAYREAIRLNPGAAYAYDGLGSSSGTWGGTGRQRLRSGRRSASIRATPTRVTTSRSCSGIETRRLTLQ